MRNRVAHAVHYPDDDLSPDWAEALRNVKDLLLGLDRAIQADYFSVRKARKNAQNGSS